MEQPKDNNVITAEADAEIERLKAELRREHEMYLRALSDFDNFRRRVERERASASQSGKRAIILPLLDVLDNFDRALPYVVEAPPALSEGLQAIQRRLLALLEAQGVTPFRSLGEVFDPALHEAIGSAPSENRQPGSVADELQRGYRMGDEVLRPARVRVAQ